MILLIVSGGFFAVVGYILHVGPQWYFSSHFDDHKIGWFTLWVGIVMMILGVVLPLINTYMRTHARTSHVERIDNNSAPGANVFDNSSRY